MVSSLNLSNLVIDPETGRVSISGGSSGIDFSNAVDSILAAKRIPYDNIEVQISERQTKITALQELQGLMQTLKNRLDALRGRLAFGSSGNIFEQKAAVSSTFRTDGQTANAAANLVGISVGNAAQTGNHTLEVLNIARAQKVRSDALTSTTTALNDAALLGGGFAGGSFTLYDTDRFQSDEYADSNVALGFTGNLTIDGNAVAVIAGDTLENIRDNINDAGIDDVTASIEESNGNFQLIVRNTRGDPVTLVDTAGMNMDNSVDVTINATDSLRDVRDRINNANKGTQATGITASIVSASSNENYLVLTNDRTGEVIQYTDGDNVLADLGISDGGGGFSNILQDYRSARFKADGLTDIDRFESDFYTSATTALGISGNLDINGTPVAVGAGDSLTDIKDNINAAAIPNITASILSDGAGSRLVITDSLGAEITLGDTNGLIEELGLDNDLVLTRTQNTVDDLIEGVTLSLYQAEEGTTINIDIENDLNAVKTSIADFVSAYNEVKIYLNAQQEFDGVAGGPAETAVLFGSASVRDTASKLRTALSSAVQGVSDAFTVLSQIGVDYVDNTTQVDPLLNDTLEIDDATLDEKLLNNFEDIQRLFSFGYSTSDSRLSLVGIDTSTGYSNGETFDITHDGTDITAVTYSGGTATFDGNFIQVTSGALEGARFFYSGTTSVSGVSIDTTTGIASEMYFDIDDLLDETAGILETEVENLTAQNELAQDRIDTGLNRLSYYEVTLRDRFARLEATLASLESTGNSIQSIIDATYNRSDS